MPQWASGVLVAPGAPGPPGPAGVDGADSTVRELRAMIGLGDRPVDGWVPPVVKTVASTGVGIEDLVAAVDAHSAWLATSGELDARRLRRARDEVEAIAVGTLRRLLRGEGQGVALDRLAADVSAGRTDAYTAARALVDGLLDETQL